MKKFLLLLLGVIFAGGLLSLSVGEQKASHLQANVFDLLKKAEQAQLDADQWTVIRTEAEELPRLYPFSIARNALLAGADAIAELHQLKNMPQQLAGQKLEPAMVLAVFESINEIDASLETILDELESVPEMFLNETQISQVQTLQRQLRYARTLLDDVGKFENVVRKLMRDEERLLILLQNQNEPRSTGGFSGSVIIIDLSAEEIAWRFSDIYALDRLVPAEAQVPAPAFFHDLSQTISLRDANFWPDFPTSAAQYRHFFRSIGEKAPHTVIGINLNLVEEILRLTGPVGIPRWGVTLDEHNFDLVLQFLVESKIEGRFGTKLPVLAFAEALFAPSNLGSLSGDELLAFDLQTFLQGKNILAASENKQLQALFERWQIDGRVRQKQKADNVLHFDFVSVGANKSEKFLWTELRHNSAVAADGTVTNTVNVLRHHALQPNEIRHLLREYKWSENVRDLLESDELMWKLGAGENRTVLRLYVPKGAKLITSRNPSSGEVMVNEDWSQDFTVFEVPLFVSPGEELEAQIQYETTISRGSVGWRPYFLQVIGTPGRDKTSFMSTISPLSGGTFTAETMNIGRPGKLIDADFRAVLEFQPETP